MNDDLISRSALLEVFKRASIGEHNFLKGLFTESIYGLIENAPAVDAVEVDVVAQMLYEAFGDKYACNFNGNDEWLEMVKARIAEAHTIDAEPVRHGRWVNMLIAKIDTTGDCTNCGQEAVWRTRNKPYAVCPNCGAKMDGDDHDKA